MNTCTQVERAGSVVYTHTHTHTHTHKTHTHICKHVCVCVCLCVCVFILNTFVANGPGVGEMWAGCITAFRV